MKCVSCNFDISSAFRHAISKNECPACGGSIMSEETMALIEDMENTILSEAAVRNETAKNLAMILVARYDISLRVGTERATQHLLPQQKDPQQKDPQQTDLQQTDPQQTEQIKFAQPSTVQQAMTVQNDEEIVKVSEMMPENISDVEREEIMAEVVREKMSMVESSVFPEEFSTPPSYQAQEKNPESDAMAKALFGKGENDILEEERMLRLAKQQRAIQSGSGGFRRGS